MASTDAVVCILLTLSSVGSARACDAGLECHYGSDVAGLMAWAATNFCPQLEAGGRCQPHNADLNCSHPLCAERRAQILLAQYPAGCAESTTRVWEALHNQCAKVHGVCCTGLGCARPSAVRCASSFTDGDTYTASVYAAVATLVGAIALLADEATIAAVTIAGPFAF